MVDFKIGDPVILISGGPTMTVEHVRDGIVSCTWFDGSKLKREKLPIGSIKLYSEIGPSVVKPKAGVTDRAKAFFPEKRG